MDNFYPDADGKCKMCLDMDELRAAMDAKGYPEKWLPQQADKFFLLDMLVNCKI